MKRAVLIVDDYPLVREVIQSVLQAHGIAVTVAKDGHEALERFAAADIPAAVVDVDMPGPNGIEVCRALHEFATAHGRTVSVWLMTGVERPGLTELATAAGALGVLQKPFTSAQLLERVEPMLTSHRSARSSKGQRRKPLSGTPREKSSAVSPRKKAPQPVRSGSTF